MYLLDDIKEYLKGKKTYLVAAGLIVLAGLKAQGYIDAAMFEMLAVAIGGAGFATIRAGMSK